MYGWIIFGGLLAIHIAVVLWLARTGRMQRWNLATMLGLILMIRTQRGRGTLDALGRAKRTWNVFGDVAIAVVLIGMVGMTVLFLWSVKVALDPAAGVEPLGADQILVLPGINPFVPLGYGILAFIITLVVHEGGHGVLARANNLAVRSVGLLWLVVPIGAFVEPDNEEMKKTSRRVRLRVYAAGPMVNLAVAGICLLGFTAMLGAATVAPGAHIAAPVADSPAARAGIGVGDTILAIDGVALDDYAAFSQAMAAHEPGDVVTFTLTDRTTEATLASRWSSLNDPAREAILANDERAIAAYCDPVMEPDPQTGGECATGLQGLPFLGVQPYLAARTESLAHPFGGSCPEQDWGGRALCRISGFLGLASLPIGEIRGAPYLSVYLPAFHDTPFAPEIFWPLLSILFWVFWIDLMVGLTNILPMLPLDGGQFFRDVVGGVVERVRPGLSEQRRDRVVGWASGAVSIVILGAFLLQILGPRFL